MINSKCRLCGDRDETINHISVCSKLAQKEYKARHDWVGKVIHWEMCGKFQFHHICGVMVIVLGNGHSDTSSNPGRD